MKSRSATHTPVPVIGQPARRSSLERTYGQFDEGQIHNDRSAAPFMRDMNEINLLCAGLETVLRIVGGNDILENNFEPDNPDSEPPLSAYAIGTLTSMASVVCGKVAEMVEQRARWYRDRIES